MSDNRKEIDQFCQAAKMLGIFSIPPVQFTALATIIGILLSCDLDADEQNSLGNFFLTIGQVLATIASQQAVFESNPDNQKIIRNLDNIRDNINDIVRQLRFQKLKISPGKPLG